MILWIAVAVISGFIVNFFLIALAVGWGNKKGLMLTIGPEDLKKYTIILGFQEKGARPEVLYLGKGVEVESFKPEWLNQEDPKWIA